MYACVVFNFLGFATAGLRVEVEAASIFISHTSTLLNPLCLASSSFL